MADLEVHITDARGVALAQAQATDRASRRAWGPGEASASTATPAADVRAIAIASYRVATELGAKGRVQIVTGAPGGSWSDFGVTLVVEDPETDPAKYPSPEHMRAALALLFSLRVFAARTGEKTPKVGSKLYVTDTDAGVAPLVYVVVALGAVALLEGAYILASKSNEVADRDLARNNNARLAMQAHADLLTLATEHAAAERAAGKTLAFNDAEKAALNAILKTHGDALARLNAEKPADPPKSNDGFVIAIAAVGAGLLLSAARD